MSVPTPTAVVGRERTDEPFAFATYAAIESARRAFGAITVHAVHLPYGFWWDTLRPAVELERDGPEPDDPLPLDGVWASAGDRVPPDDPRHDRLADALRAPVLRALGR